MSYAKFLLLLLLGALFVLSAAHPVQACSCVGPGTVLDSYERATQVIVAKAISVEKKDPKRKLAKGAEPSREEGDYSYGNLRAIWMKVEKVYKGTLKVGDEIKLAQGGAGDCIWTFSEESVGQKYLFYLDNEEKESKLWYAGTCGRSNSLTGAADDLLYLDNMAKAKGKTRLSGTLSFYMSSLLEDESNTYKQLPGLKVLVSGKDKAYELQTDKNGVYEIYDLPPGSYSVALQIPDGMEVGFPSQSFVKGDMENMVLEGKDVNDKEEKVSKAEVKDTSGLPKTKESFAKGFQVTILKGKHAYLDMTYGVSNTLRGVVLDPNNNPLPGVRVAVIPKEGKPRKGYFPYTDYTKADGSFEINEVPPGSYLLAANEENIVSSTEPFGTIYYPNVTEREKAAVITLGFGESEDGLILHAPSLSETITVEGVFLYSDGKPVAEQWVKFGARETDKGVYGDASSQTDSQGRFSFKILKGLKGTLRGNMNTYAGQFDNCPKLEALIKKSGTTFAEMQTQEIKIEASGNIYNVELRFPFSSCKKAKSE